MGEAKRKRSREATVEDLMAAQAEWRSQLDGKWAGKSPPGNPALPSHAEAHQGLNQADLPPELNVFANMEDAWKDFEDHWVHIGLPAQHRDALRFAFYVGAQAASNLMMYCEGQDMFGVAADQLQKDVTEFYHNEVAPKIAAAKADEWRTGEI